MSIVGSKKKKVQLTVRPGDVFSAKVKDGRYGAIRVLRFMAGGHGPGIGTAFIATTDYLGSAPPRLDDPALGTILVNRRFQKSGGFPAVSWIEDPPAPDFVYVGNGPLSAEQLAFKPQGQFGSSWHSLLEDVLTEWRWIHDREALVAEVEAARVRPMKPVSVGPRVPTKGATLTEEGFWKLIRLLRWESTESEEILEPLEAELRKLKNADLLEFEEILAEKLYALDGERFADAAGEAGKSDDAFLYARCYVVARGDAFYNLVLSDPSKFPPDVDLEPILYVVEQAYSEKTGESFDHTTHYSYESGSNKAGWPGRKTGP
jgi:hypothetical protein